MRSSRLLYTTAWAAGVALCMAVTTTFAASPMRIDGEPAPMAYKDHANLELRSAGYPQADVIELRLPPIASSRLDAVRAVNAEPGVKALQIGVDRNFREESTLEPTLALSWLPVNGGSAARFAVSSPGAAAVRIGVGFVGLPKSAELRFVGDGQSSSVVDVVTPSEIMAQLAKDIYWTPVTEGERQTVEIYLPSGVSPGQIQVTIDSVAHLLASPYGSLKGLKIGESDFCEIDANCISNPSAAYINAKNAVARMSYQKNGGSFLCSGTLLNDTVTTSFVPYFFSANHCIDNQTVASTLTTFWFEESTSCGSGVAGNRVQVSGGATLLFNDAATDALMLRLNSAAPNGAWFTGWDSSAVTAGTNITVLHHPAGDVKKVTLGQITGFGPYNGAGSFIRAGYTNGTTEGGSSGSGILTFASNQYVLRGGLFGGSASCANTGNVATPANSDAFSRFDVVFPSLQQFLAPSAPPPTQQLQNGVAVAGLSGAAGAALNYTVVIPSGATNLVVSTSGGSGDADLYVRFGSAPTTSTYDCRSFGNTNTEQCTFAAPSAGTYHVLVNGFAAFSGVTLAASWNTGTSPPPGALLTVVEYYSAQLDHYFISSAPAEQAFLDAGSVIDFRRTGLQFRAYELGTPNLAAVCRFYSQSVNSHFYTASSAECNLVNTTMPIWRYERNEFAIALPSGPGCPSGTTPVYRNYNNRGDFNHRFTINLATYNTMVAAGWRAEGIVMCAPL